MKSSFSAGFACVLCLSLFVVVPGCSKSDQPSTAPVTGKVTYKGEPVPQAGVTFTPSQGRPATGQTNAQGEFTLRTYAENDGAVLGEHVVTISKFEKPPAPEGGDPGRAAPSPNPPKSLLPPKYYDPRQTPLRATVKAGEPNAFTFELTD